MNRKIEMEKEGFLRRTGDFLSKYKYLNLMALPCLAYFLIFHYLPMYGVIIAFKDYRGGGGLMGIFEAPWVGLKHFKLLFGSIYFSRLMRNTVLISLYRILWGFPAPILLALLLNEVRNKKFKSVVQTITYMPHFLSWVVISGLVLTILSPENGPVGALFKLVGLEPIFFVSDKRIFRSLLVGSGIWKSIGWGSIVYLAAISGIPQEQYESAYMDGANRFQLARYITIPSLQEIIAILLILRVGKILNESFEQIFNLYNPSVYEVADVFETYVYRSGIGQARFSYASAVGLFKSVASMILIILSNKLAKKMGTFGIW